MEAPVENTTEKLTSDIQEQNGGEDNSKTVEPEKQIPDEISKPKDSEKKPVKKTKEEKKNKEEEKRIKLLLRTFEGIEDADARIYAIAKKYVQLAADNKSLQYKKDDLESRSEKLTKERDNLQSDYNKATLAKSKLESLCRELQRHSKLVKEECQLRAQEEEAKRKELSDRFQTTINDISQQMQDNFKRNEQLKTENEELAVKLKGLISQYETREEHVDKVVQHKQLELQLAEAKMAQQSLQFNEMKEKSLIEKQELLKDSMDYRKRYELMVQQEKELKTQLSMYTERFDEIQSTLNKSNEVFATFKSEMDKMSKTIKKLEKENKTLKTRSENTNRSLLAMLEERTNMEKQIQMLTTKNSKLENLCRAMQRGALPQTKDNQSEEPIPVEPSNSDKNGSHPSHDDSNNTVEQEPNNDQGQTTDTVTENDGGQSHEEDTENNCGNVDNKEQDETESGLKEAGNENVESREELEEKSATETVPEQQSDS